MIAKKVPNPGGGREKSARVSKLADYITEPQLTNGFEKCVASGAENFISSTFEGKKSEMIALSLETNKSKDPIDHWVLSFRYGEHPTQVQAMQAVEIFIDHCGLKGHQYIWGLHDDTRNKHIHIEVNRVNPVTLRVTKINKGFDREAAQQAIALIEHDQGWQKEGNARYNIENGKPVLSEKGAIAKNYGKPLEPSTRAKDMEVQTGEKSAERIGIEIAAPIIKNCSSWKELHDQLAAHGMKYERKGSGAMVYVGGIALKASAVDRSASLSNMQKRFGLYQPPQEINKNDYFDHTTQSYATSLGEDAGDDLRSLSECRLAYGEKGKQTRRTGVLHVDARFDRPGADRLRRDTGRDRGTRLAPQPMRQDQLGWKEYIAIRDAQRAEKALATTALQKRHNLEREQLYLKFKNEQSTLLSDSWKGKCSQRNAAASVLAVSHTTEKFEQRERHANERKKMKNKYKQIPQYKAWLEEPSITFTSLTSMMIEDEEREKRELQRLAFARSLSLILRGLTYSIDIRGHVTYTLFGKDMFRDEGRRIAVLDKNSDMSIAAALTLAQQKFGQILNITGSIEFQQRVVAVAVENNMQVNFSDPTLDALRERLQTEKRQAEIELTIKSKLISQMAAPHSINQKEQSEYANAPAVDEIVSEQIDVPLATQEWAETHAKISGKPLTPLRAGDAVVVYLSESRVLLSLGRNITICTKPSSLELKVGQMVVIGKDGILKLHQKVKANKGLEI
jgi:hypothetical protein